MHLATGGRVNLTACGCPRANGVFAATAWVFLAVLLGRHHRLPMAVAGCRWPVTSRSNAMAGSFANAKAL